MDSEREHSLRDSVDANEETWTGSALEKLGNVVNGTEVLNNGPRVVEDNDNNEFSEGTNGKIIGVNSPPLEVTSQVSPSPVMRKGNGLRKWRRRVRRDTNKGGEVIVDASKILIESSSTPVANSSKRMQFSEEVKQKSEGSVSSTSAVERNMNGFIVLGDSGLVIEPSLFAGIDSENSGDQSSKSSTAASTPKTRYEMPKVVRLPQDKIKTRSLSGKNLGNSVQRDQHRKGRLDSGKKARGDRAKVEMENSRSSIESDSRSSNFTFMLGTYSAKSNGVQNDNSNDYDGETGNNPSWEVKEEGNETHGPSQDHDPLIDSIFALQSVQEALEKEVQKLREIGKEDFYFDDPIEDLPSGSTSVNPKLYQTNSGEPSQSSDGTLNVMVAKEGEPGTVVNSMSLEATEEREIDAALEDLFKRKIEAEVEYLVISRMIQKLTAAVDGRILLGEEKTLASEQAQVLNRLGNAKNGAAILNKEVEKVQNLENHCKDIVSADVTMKLRKRMWKYVACFLVQLVMLIVIIEPFILQISPDYTSRLHPT